MDGLNLKKETQRESQQSNSNNSNDIDYQEDLKHFDNQGMKQESSVKHELAIENDQEIIRLQN